MLKKPKTLKSGSRVAAVSLSSGLGSTFPEVYAWGKRQLEENFGLELVPMTHTLDKAEDIYEHPAWRVADFYEAWERPDIDGVISVIGGDDSVRLLKLWDRIRLSKTAKVFMGCSDSTVTHLFLNKCGIRSFYGPAVLYGIADFGGMSTYSADAFRKAVMSGEVIGEIKPFTGNSVAGSLPWKDPDMTKLPQLRVNPPWSWLNGRGVSQGRLFGGCIEVICPLAFSTKIWPTDPNFWEEKILFLEYSRELANSEYTLWFFRALAAQGILSRIKGLLLGRQHHQVKSEEGANILESLLKVVIHEEGLHQLPVIANMDFGHVQPMLTLPYGALTEIDCQQQKIFILESGTL